MNLSIDGNHRRRRLSSQVVKTMKLTFIFLTAAFLQVSAKTYSQVTLSLKNAPMEQVFKEIKRQTGYDFLYTKKVLEEMPKVTINVENASVTQVLAECFKGQSLEYAIDNNTIVIKRKKTGAFEPPVNSPTTKDALSTFFPPPPIDIRGKVVNENGEPVAGATVKVKGSTIGTTTDVNGEFALNGIDDKATLVFSGTNIETFEQRVNGRRNLDLTATTKVTSMNEVVINKGYYTEKQKLSVSNVGRITAKDIEKQPVSNPLLALQGRVTGVTINQNTGMPGGGITVRIQGQNSLSRGVDPLYIIDGVPYVSQALPNIARQLGIFGDNGNNNPTFEQSGGGNPLSFINPSDIETIEILKDADATAIYGSRAANGVILITTKKGKTGKTKVDINIQNGYGKIVRKLDLLNTQHYLEMRDEAFRNDGIIPGATNYDINGTWDRNRFTDWQDALIGGTANYTSAQASVSGGTANTHFLVGTGYHRETTVFPGELSNQKSSLHFSLNNISTNQKFRFQLSGNYLIDNKKLSNIDLTTASIQIAPNAPSLYKDDGTLNWEPLSNGTSTWVNPLSFLKNKYNNRTKNLIANAEIAYKLLNSLEIKTSFGYNSLDNNEYVAYPLTAVAPELRPTTTRISDFSNGRLEYWIVEPQATYNRKLGKGSLSVLLGSSFQQRRSNLQSFNARGFTNDASMEDIKSAATVTVSQTLASTYRYNAIFGRINYNFLDRYIINFTGRRDGSSRFGSENLFNNFGAIGAAWIFSVEPFMHKLSFLSFGKLRASYGTTGSDQIGDYQFMSLYNPYSVASPFQSTVGLLPAGLPNPHLQWEETRKLQAGIDVGFMKDNLIFNFNYYRNRSSNLLQAYSLPYTSGRTTMQINFPALIENTGIEINLSTKNITKKKFTWTSSFNITFPKNKLIEYPGLASSTLSGRYVIGQSFTASRYIHLSGVDPGSGLYYFADYTGNPTSGPDFSKDATKLLDIATPQYYGGLLNTFQVAGFTLDVLFQFANQTGANYRLGNQPGYFYSDNMTSMVGNQPTYVLNRWQKPGDQKPVQRFGTSYSGNLGSSYSNASFSDVRYTDASYIRLKNASLSWALPESWQKKVGVQNCKIYAQGQNLFTITNYEGFDPESRNVSSLPPLRVMTLGLQITL